VLVRNSRTGSARHTAAPAQLPTALAALTALRVLVASPPIVYSIDPEKVILEEGTARQAQ